MHNFFGHRSAAVKMLSQKGNVEFTFRGGGWEMVHVHRSIYLSVYIGCTFIAAETSAGN